MNNVLITIGVLIVAVLSALFAIPYFVDWNSYRGVIEEEASRIIGRDVRIGGDIKLQLLPAPSFVIQKLRVADGATGTGEPLFRAERVDAKLSIVPLVRGVLEANQIELVKPVVRFVLDEAGNGNWRSLTQGRGTLPFVPNDVALQSVKITDGTVSIFDRAGNRERLSMADINGQLSAPALEGPYRFRGVFGEGPQARELRFTTLPPAADGVVQIKVGLKDVLSNASASLDGQLRGLSGQPELTGELSAQLPVRTEAPASGNVDRAKVEAAPVAGLKATLVGSAKEIALTNLSIAFDGGGRPEVLAGGAVFSWQDERTTVAKLTSPWIDLDHVLGNPKGGNPLRALADFAQRINGLATGIGKASAVIEIQQASLGQDVVSGIRIEARSSAGLLAVEEVRANLPGGTKVELQGRIAGEGGATTFDGDMTVRGSSLARLAGWVTGGRAIIDPLNDQSFEMSSRVTAEPARGGLRDIFATIGDSMLQGEVDYAWGATRKLRLTISGLRLDARAVAPAKFSLATFAEFLGPAPVKSSPTDTPSSSAAALAIAFNVQAGELLLPDQTLRNVAASVESTAAGLLVDRFQFSADHGVAVSLEGRLGSDRNLRGSIAAADLEGVQKLADFFNFPLDALVPGDILPDLLPLKLAGTLAPEAGTAAVLVTADGRAGLTDAKVRVSLAAGTNTLAAGTNSWRTSPADIDVVLLAPPEVQLAAKILSAMRLEKSTSPQSWPAEVGANDRPTIASRLAVRATGIPADGMSTGVRFDSPDLTLYFNGLGHIAGDGSKQLAGSMTLDARDSRNALLALGGIRLGLTEPLALQGSARLNIRSGGIALSRIELASGGGTKISGRLVLDPPTQSAGADKGRRRLGGELSFSSLDLSALLSPVLQQRPAEAQAAIQVTSGRSGIWPDQNFDFAGNSPIDAALAIKADRLIVAENIGLADASVMLISRPGAIELRELTGVGMGGRLTGSVVLDSTPAGAAMTAKVEFKGMQTSAFGAAGSADLNLTVTGSGINPAGLVSAMTGSGSVKIATAKARALSPETLLGIIETALKSPAERLSGVLRSAVAADTARGEVELGPRTIALTVQDGVVRAQPLTMASGQGRIVGAAALDLASFGMIGDWRVETRMPPLPALPAVAGQPVAVPVPTPATLLPAVVQRFAFNPREPDPARASRRAAPETEALERELAVRKVERDLAELERLRRFDEERAAARAAEDKAADEAQKARQSENQTNGLREPALLPR